MYVVFKNIGIDLIDLTEIIKNKRGIISRNLDKKEWYYRISILAIKERLYDGSTNSQEILGIDIWITNNGILIFGKIDKKIEPNIELLKEFIRLAIKLLIGIKLMTIEDVEFIEENKDYLYFQYMSEVIRNVLHR